MELLLQEIENALKAKLYYLAIVATVTIPDVCAALASPDGTTNSALYKAWYNENVGKTLTWFTDTDCWKFRCGGVHQGRFGHPQMQYSRAVFLLPGPITEKNGRSRFGDDYVYTYSAAEFCAVFVQAARKWYEANKGNPHVKANIEHLIQLRPDGLLPHYKGIAVIA